MPVINRLAELHAEKEKREKRRIPLSEVARQASIKRQTVAAWYSGEVSTYYPEIIEALCKYYECDISDLLSIVEENDLGQPVALAVG